MVYPRRSVLGLETSIDSSNSFENIREYFVQPKSAHKLSSKIKYRYSFRRRIIGKSIQQALQELVHEANKAQSSSLHQDYEKVLISAITEFQIRLILDYEIEMAEITYQK